ncbi:MarR family winged helix-turn-helix transcriptional regulator [Paenibacillus puerhi]|uniref:MarR family winged helix-turn-helix transcriptional regulator n=1 Tax=Paenibacillus puerhi TaxID=2692622 RepID=UPI0038B2343D
MKSAKWNADDLMKLDNQFCFAVYACAREVTKLYRPHLDQIGLTYTQYIVLLVLWERDDITVKDLGARLYLDSGTLTPLLKKLESMKLLRRFRDPSDERSVRIRLTAEGALLREQALDIPRKVFCIPGLPAEEIDELRQRMNALLRLVHPLNA